MQQKRVRERDAEDRYRIRQSQQRRPLVISETEEIVKGDDEIAGMPSANTQSENKKYSLERRQLAPTRQQQYCQPQRQHRADAVADQLEDFEWGHESVGSKQEAGCRRQAQ